MSVFNAQDDAKAIEPLVTQAEAFIKPLIEGLAPALGAALSKELDGMTITIKIEKKDAAP